MDSKSSESTESPAKRARRETVAEATEQVVPDAAPEAAPKAAPKAAEIADPYSNRAGFWV